MGIHEIRAYYDAEIDLLMVELPHGDVPPADSARLARDVFLDVEPEGAPLLLEVLRASKHYPSEWLRGIPAAPDEPLVAPVAPPSGPDESPIPPARIGTPAAPQEPTTTWTVGPHSLRATRQRALAGR